MRWTARTLAVLGGGVLAAVLLVGLTPAGPWLLDRLVRSVGSGQGWSISIAGREGTLVTGFALIGVTAESPTAGVRVAMARVEFSPWSYAVAVRDPRVELEIRPAPAESEPEPSPPPRLPVEDLPALTVTGGRVEVRWPVDHRQVVAEGLELTYAAQTETLGTVQAQVGRLACILAPGTDLTGTARLRLRVGPSSLVADTLGVELANDSLSVAALLHASLALLPGWPMAASLETHGTVGPRTVQARLATAGRLEPLGVSMTLRGQAEDPGLGPVSLQADGQATAAVVQVDSLRLQLLDGEVSARGAYHPPLDSLDAEVALTGIELSRLTPALETGPLGGTLRLRANTAAGRYEADLALSLARLRLTGEAATEVRVTGHLGADHGLELSLSSRVLELTAKGRADLAAVPRAGSYDLRFEGTADPSLVAGATSPPLRLRGTANPDTVRLWLETAGLPGPVGKGFGPLALTATLLANRWLAAHLDLEQGLLAADLGLDLHDSNADSLIASVRSLDLSRLAPGLSATVQGQVRVTGLLDESGPRLSARLETDQAEYAGWHTGPLTVDLARRDRTITAALTGAGFNLQGRLGPDDQLHAELACDGVMLRGAEFGPTAGDQLYLLGGGTWNGPMDRPEQGRGSLDLPTLLLRQSPYEVRSLAPLRLRFEQGTVHLDQVRLQTPVGPFEATGALAEDSLAVVATVAVLDLSPLAPGLSHQPGRMALHLGGSAARPEIRGEADLSGVFLDSLLLGDARLRVAMADTLAAEVQLLQGEPAAPVARLVLAVPAAPLVRGVTAADEGEAVLAMDARGVDLAAPLSFALGQPTSGRLSMSGRVSAPLARLDSAWSWRTLRGDLRFDEMRLQTLFDGDSLRLEVVPGGRVVAADDQVELHDLRLDLTRYSSATRAFVPSGRLRLAGGLRSGTEARLTANLEDADLLLFGGPAGRGSLRAAVSGTLTRPEVQVDLEALTDELGTVQGRLRGDAAGGRLEAVWTLGSAADSLVLDGELPWNLAEGRLDYEQARLHLQSAGIDLALLESLVPELDRLRGRVSTDLRVNGLGDRLDLQGEVTVRDLEVGLLDIKPIYRFPGGRLVFSGRRGELQGFTSPTTAENGAMTLTGGLDLSAPADLRYRVRLETDNLVCHYLDLFRAPEIDLDVTLDGSSSASRASGSVRLRNAVAEPILVAFNAPPVPPPPPTLRDPFLENMVLGIQIDIRDLKVDSELAEVQVSGAVDVGGTFYKPVFQGDIEIDRGQVFVLNRQFDFDRGRIVLNSLVPTRSLLDVAYDPFLLNPDLDLAASCKVTPIDEEDTEYSVTLSLQGPVQTASPEFTSDPALDFSGIFRLLAFGSVSSQLEYSAALGTAAGQLLSKKVEKVGLDEFMVLPSTRPDIGTVGQPSLRLGKYFDQLRLPLWVRYEAAIGEMSSGEVRTEYKLRPYLTLSGSAQSRYDRYGLGLGLKKDF